MGHIVTINLLNPITGDQVSKREAARGHKRDNSTKTLHIRDELETQRSPRQPLQLHNMVSHTFVSGW